MSSIGHWKIVRMIKFLLWNGPLLACWSLFLVSIFVKELWYGPLDELLQSFRVEEVPTPLGTNRILDKELTYYHRRCDHRDISTHDANDLLIDPNMNLKERQDVAMTHGAVVMKDIISHDTAVELRAYLETRHHEFHTNNLELPWDELFWDGDGGTRLSLGLGPEDTSIVARAIAEAGSNPQLKKTLESILGDDPAVVEVSTLSTMFDAEPQEIHTDSDFFASSVLYTRSFLHSYTMFVSLQDTTSRMGATTICPGTHWCADEDLSTLCQCNFFDEDENEQFPIGYCNTFEASSNGQTGLDVGVLKRGDAMMFNQNIWHRGPRNYDPKRKENRAMFIMTFVSRRDYEQGDNRQQGWGTFYYMRHSMWGHLFSDLKTAASGGMDLFTKRIWKAYGLIGARKPGNVPWLEHWARQMANDMDFFRDSEVYDFIEMLNELCQRNRLADWLFLPDAAMKFLFGDDAFGEDDEVGWHGYLDLLVKSAHHQSKRLYSTVLVVTLLANVVLCSLYFAIGRFLRRSLPSSATEAPRPIGYLSKSLRGIVVGHLLVLGIAAAARHYVLHSAPLFKRIHNGDINFSPFPPPPTETFTDTLYNEDGEPVGEETYQEELYPVEILIRRQDEMERKFQMEQPRHPHAEYFERELERVKDNRLATSDYFTSPIEFSLDLPQPPDLVTAFPERYDVLIGSRFDADFLASMNFVLDFHPGTKEWITLMKEHKPSLAEKYTDEAYLDMAVDTIVSKILDRNDGSTLSLFSKEGGTPRRFLQQDYETGWWLSMSRAEAKIATKQALLAMAHPLSVGVSRDHWKQVLSESRFGKRRHTVLAKQWIPKIVDKMLNNLFPNYAPRENVMPAVRAQKTLLPSTGRGLLPKSIITGKTAVSPFAQILPQPLVIPTREHLRKLMKGVATLKIGDHILFKGSDDQELFYQATIVSISADSDELEIQPLRSDDISEEFSDVTIWVHINHVQYYRPAEQGDTVWSLTINPDEESRSWTKYNVLFLTPFGQIQMIMNGEFIERYSEEDDSFQPRPIARDFKEVMLVEDSVPEFRLRQYS
eukprot:CAMPEP_0116125718 /NCGR_PEP_ID=MMETSP0329-20121206/5957_1 /TAXON_ID=697910 /ORGANISM="Pseudo-nitzschia arenysensis, Strain B593" /LENGTH=1049 /DNA_ID=CAMNT_0003619771 /DNA_START=197 /DNA_END=3346 /DNA_ORIENTATION=+